LPSAFFNSLSKEGQTLVHQAMDYLRPRYNPAIAQVSYHPTDPTVYNLRASMYYALGLMLLHEEGCVEEVEKICRAVIATQVDAPQEMYHGCYQTKRNLNMPQGVMDYKRLGVYGRFYVDCFYERLMDQFRLNMGDDEEIAPLAGKIEQMVNRSVVEAFPVTWSNYGPNIREFLMICFAMLLEHFEDEFSPETVALIDRSCLVAMEGAVVRAETEFSPLNTNIECMYVIVVDYFAKRLKRPDFAAAALSYAERMLKRYEAYHAVSEFNSPTYCGVDLATLGFWRRYGSCPRIREIGAILEEGIWRDVMTYYNPAMRNICGPYSRAYELEMSLHTHYHALWYWTLGEEKFPEHPFTNESDSNPLLVFGSVNIPEDALRAMEEPKEDVVITRQFRELSERGDPANNDALCTCTSWISPDLMTGCMDGSENPSYQLHPLVVFWRGEKGLGTIKLLRSWPDGGMHHMHTVFFHGKADRNHLTMDVDFQVNRDVKLYYEIEYPGVCEAAEIADDLWKLPGLNVKIQAQAPGLFLEKSADGNILKVCYMSRARASETKQMSFDMLLEMNS